MISARDIATRSGHAGIASLRALGAAHQTESLQALAASQTLRDWHRAGGGDFGSLGKETGAIALQRDGSYTRQHLLGKVRLANGTPFKQETVHAVIEFMGIQCLDPNDKKIVIIEPEPDDEPYVVVSVILLNPELADGGGDRMVVTQMFRFDDVLKGSFHGQTSTVYDGPVPGLAGLLISAAVFDHDEGSPSKVRDEIRAALLKAAGEAASAIGTAVGAGADAGGAFADSELVQWAAGILSHGITAAIGLGDDKIGVKSIEIEPGKVNELRHGSAAYEQSLIRGVLPDERTFNYPPKHQEVIVGAGARYQVYFRVSSYLTTVST
jgi:hypothetical protein